MTVFVRSGGGGLVAGVAAALKQAAGMSGSSGSSPSWRTMPGDRSRPGRIVGLAGPSESMADAIKVQQLGDLVFFSGSSLRRRHRNRERGRDRACDDTCLVVSQVWIVEPGGAVGFAAALRAAKHQGGQHRCSSSAAANVTLERLLEIQALPKR